MPEPSNGRTTGMSGVLDYSTDPNANTTINAINIGEGCPPGNINNAIRQQMADMATWLTAPTFPAGTNVSLPGTLSVSGGVSSPGGLSGDSLTINSNGGTRGYASLLGGNPGTSGYVGFYYPNGNVAGYIGQIVSGGPVNYVSSNSVGHNFVGGGVTVNGPFAATSDIKSGGKTFPANNDANFYLTVLSGNPAIVMSSNGDFVILDRSSDKFLFYIRNVAVASIDASGNIRAIGQLFAQQSSV